MPHALKQAQLQPSVNTAVVLATMTADAVISEINIANNSGTNVVADVFIDPAGGDLADDSTVLIPSESINKNGGHFLRNGFTVIPSGGQIIVKVDSANTATFYVSYNEIS